MRKALLKDVGDRSILYAMAMDAEYGPHLRRRIIPLMTGVGPVEAAVVLSASLARLEANGNLPSLVVSLGSAGSRSLEQTGIYQVSAVCCRDMDVSPLSFEKGVTPFLDLPTAVPLPFKVPGIPEATLSTGASVISGRAIDADMVDMATIAVLRACQFYHLPLIGLRGIFLGARLISGMSATGRSTCMSSTRSLPPPSTAWRPRWPTVWSVFDNCRSGGATFRTNRDKPERLGPLARSQRTGIRR